MSVSLPRASPQQVSALGGNDQLPLSALRDGGGATSRLAACARAAALHRRPPRDGGMGHRGRAVVARAQGHRINSHLFSGHAGAGRGEVPHAASLRTACTNGRVQLMVTPEIVNSRTPFIYDETPAPRSPRPCPPPGRGDRSKLMCYRVAPHGERDPNAGVYLCLAPIGGELVVLDYAMVHAHIDGKDVKLSYRETERIAGPPAASVRAGRAAYPSNAPSATAARTLRSGAPSHRSAVVELYNRILPERRSRAEALRAAFRAVRTGNGLMNHT
jgi:hypothetical protein